MQEGKESALELQVAKARENNSFELEMEVSQEPLSIRENISFPALLLFAVDCSLTFWVEGTVLVYSYSISQQNEVLPGTSAPANALLQTNATHDAADRRKKYIIHEHRAFSMN